MFKKQLALNRQCSANKALHRTAIPLRSIAASELGRCAAVAKGVLTSPRETLIDSLSIASPVAGSYEFIGF